MYYGFDCELFEEEEGGEIKEIRQVSLFGASN